LRNLDGFYQNATLSEKQLIIGSVFPEKLIFEKNHFRTNRVNEAIILMSMKPNDLGQKKSGRSKKVFTVVHSGRDGWIRTNVQPGYRLSCL